MVAKKKIEEEKKGESIHVIHVYADSATEWNCSQWRSLTPSNAINYVNEHNGGTLTMKLMHISGFLDYLNPGIQELIAPANLIVVQRNLVNDIAIETMRYWQGMGKPVVVDLDDAYHILPWSNPAHKFWMENESDALSKLETGLKQSNGLLAPNRLLLMDWKHVTRGYFVQNYADDKFWEKSISRLKAKKDLGLTGRTVIGWGGSVSHYDSWKGSGALEALAFVAHRHPEVTILICGNDQRIYDYLEVPQQQKQYQMGVPPAQWPNIVKAFDIGVAPLYGPYDQRRSWIKGLEYLLAGVPWVATDGEPYHEIRQFGNMVNNGATAWENALENVLSNFSEYQKVALGRMKMAKQWYAVNQTETLRSTFEQIVKDTVLNNVRLPGVHHV